ncbi:hypothetical protein C8F04DRAFT_1202226 [Mycena alexandri]|uniref:Uncharacterized protein n=1 Tax=Mycena alexandri TaxID=1745969 RepID=A0AAD6S057_9AGAR|nr:hypothetical protein C8F04DRAFT_1202226 [Mycena alexandri]
MRAGVRARREGRGGVWALGVLLWEEAEDVKSEARDPSPHSDSQRGRCISREPTYRHHGPAVEDGLTVNAPATTRKVLPPTCPPPTTGIKKTPQIRSDGGMLMGHAGYRMPEKDSRRAKATNVNPRIVCDKIMRRQNIWDINASSLHNVIPAHSFHPIPGRNTHIDLDNLDRLDLLRKTNQSNTPMYSVRVVKPTQAIVDHDHQKQLTSTRGLMVPLKSSLVVRLAIADPSAYQSLKSRTFKLSVPEGLKPQPSPSSQDPQLSSSPSVLKPFLPRPHYNLFKPQDHQPSSGLGRKTELSSYRLRRRERGAVEYIVFFVKCADVANIVKGRMLAITHYIISSVAHLVMAL